MKKYFAMTLAVLTLLTPLIGSAQIISIPSTSSYCFSNNLTIGSVGEDVHALQVLLNLDPATVITTSGSGSPGNESMYYGSLTAAAVTRFQQKYAAKILAPLGLTAGTGVVGGATRLQMNTMMGCGTAGQTSSSAATGTTAATGADSGTVKPVAFSVSTDQPTYKQGQDIVITVTLLNVTDLSEELHFNSGCQASYSIPTAGFVQSQICTQAVSVLTLAPRQSKTWTFTHKSSDKLLTPGLQTVRATLGGYGYNETSFTVTQ